MTKKIRFIVNPFSGTSLKSNISQLLEEQLDKTIYDYDIHFTEYPYHAKELAREAVEDKVDILAVVGGDGTVNEVASQLVHSEIALAVLPGGSGNGFAMHLGMGRNIKKSIQYLSNSKTVAIDSCTANEKFFINIAGVGFDAMVANLSKKDKSRGLWLYIRYTIMKAFRYKEKHLKIQIDDMQFSGEFLSVSAANGSMFGYNFRIAPKALLTDGLLDIVLIRKAPFWRYLFSFWRFLNRTAEKLDFVDFINCTTMSVQSESDISHHLDGEGMGTINRLEVQIKPASLKVVVPAHMIS